MKKGVYISVIALLAAAFLISAVYLGNYLINSKQQANRYDELAQMTQVETQPSAPTEPTATEPPESTAPAEKPTETTVPVEDDGSGILIPYQKLYKSNSDMVGWLRIDGTKLNYPVVQSAVNNKDYYLYRNFDKADNDHGCIYAREECDIFAPSDNITMYGHNMKDGSMFACLGAYTDKKAWEDNSLITFDTLYEYHVYKIFAVFKTTALLNQGFSYHKFENAANQEEFDEFISTCKKLSFYDTGITPTYGDKLICLSTCEYTLDDGRLVVAAVRIA